MIWGSHSHSSSDDDYYYVYLTLELGGRKEGRKMTFKRHTMFELLGATRGRPDKNLFLGCWRGRGFGGGVEARGREGGRLPPRPVLGCGICFTLFLFENEGGYGIWGIAHVHCPPDLFKCFTFYLQEFKKEWMKTFM
ncbi:hypothetical protein AMTR_s00077p00109190, partial [Amborella trichopoda]